MGKYGFFKPILIDDHQTHILKRNIDHNQKGFFYAFITVFKFIIS